MSLRLQVQTYSLWKLGANRGECEDALASNMRTGAIAVADGATEAFDSRYWARLLARAWVRCGIAVTVPSFLQLAQCLGQRAHRRWENRKLSWYAEEKARVGSYAAFVGALFQAEGENAYRWQVIAIGDSCFLQIRNGKLLRAVPISSPEEFGNRLVLLPSNVLGQPAVMSELKTFDGVAEPGDVFLLLSDAIANWLMAAFPANERDVHRFLRLLSEGRTDQLDIFADECRSSGEMRNDDIAAIHVQIV